MFRFSFFSTFWINFATPPGQIEKQASMDNKIERDQEARYLDIVVEPIRVCACYKPKFG